MHLIPSIFDPARVIAAQSTRKGGVSPEPFHSLNLGMSVSDGEENVMENRRLFFGGLGISLSQLSKSHQVHGTEVLVVSEPGNHEGYDAQVTNVRGLFLVASVADCTPVLVHDERNNVVAAIHAGWRGTAGKIVSKTISTMAGHFGTKGVDCKAFIGACIGYENFEVGAEVAENFGASVKRYDSSRDRWFVDLKSENRQQLLDAGLLPGNIEVTNHCTVADNHLFFSHRFEKGRTGRMMAVIGIR